MRTYTALQLQGIDRRELHELAAGVVALYADDLAGVMQPDLPYGRRPEGSFWRGWAGEVG